MEFAVDNTHGWSTEAHKKIKMLKIVKSAFNHVHAAFSIEKLTRVIHTRKSVLDIIMIVIVNVSCTGPDKREWIHYVLWLRTIGLIFIIRLN